MSERQVCVELNFLKKAERGKVWELRTSYLMARVFAPFLFFLKTDCYLFLHGTNGFFVDLLPDFFMNNIRPLILVLLLFPAVFSFAQEKDFAWHNPASEKLLTVHNQIWAGSDLGSFYDRLPAKAEGVVRKEVWDLSRNAAGLKLVFQTDAEAITVRYTLSKKNYAMSHFPATGVSGIDMFAENKDGSWAWANGKYSFKDTVTYSYTGLQLNNGKYEDGRIYHLYLPLYNNIQWLEIGIPTDKTFKFIPVPDEKPIVVYGTSIAQGGCASRPGMAWTNILERHLRIPVANLGFSGNGRLEKEVIDLIVEKEARMYVIDCLPNMSGDIANIKSKLTYAVNAIREKHPNTPIIIVDGSHYTEGRLNESRSRGIMRMNSLSYEACQELISKGIHGLYYLKKDDIGLDMNDSVDGTHPTDMGMLKYAKAYEKLIRSILKE